MKKLQKMPYKFDYSALSEDDRREVQLSVDEIRKRVQNAAHDIIAIGGNLIDVKSRLPHGQFGAWLAAEFEWSERSAQRMMMVAEQFKSDTVSDLDIGTKALYLLASPSTPESVRAGVLADAKAGKTITHAEVKEKIEVAVRRRARPPTDVEDDGHQADARGTVSVNERADDDSRPSGACPPMNGAAGEDEDDEYPEVDRTVWRSELPESMRKSMSEVQVAELDAISALSRILPRRPGKSRKDAIHLVMWCLKCWEHQCERDMQRAAADDIGSMTDAELRARDRREFERSKQRQAKRTTPYLPKPVPHQRTTPSGPVPPPIAGGEE